MPKAVMQAVHEKPCPECKGEGEVHFNAERNEWGRWDADSEACRNCDGWGALALDAQGYWVSARPVERKN